MLFTSCEKPLAVSKHTFKAIKGTFTAVMYVTLNESMILRSQIKVGIFKKIQFCLKIQFLSFQYGNPENIFFPFANIALFISLFILATKPDNPDAE